LEEKSVRLIVTFLKISVNYFLKTVDELIGLPYSRDGITDAWRELAHDNREVAGMGMKKVHEPTKKIPTSVNVCIVGI
jgi:hypothetical protein